MRRFTFAGWLAVTAWFGEVADRARRDETGAVTTEMAVVTALLALGAVAVVAIIVTAATDWANSIPGAPG